jgi:5-methylcytosine-specific restriction endonuclease McrA
MESKRCTKCEEIKPLESFSTRKLRNGSVSRVSHCRECRNAKNRAAYAANPGPTIARTIARNKLHADEHRETARKSMAKRRTANPEASREINRRWARGNPDIVTAADRRKRERNPDLYRKIGAQTSAIRRARMVGAYVEDVDRDQVWRRYAGTCHLCGLPAGTDWQLEHVVPLASGGAHSYQNAAVSHPFCNQSKNDGYVPSALGLLGAYVIRPNTCS